MRRLSSYMNSMERKITESAINAAVAHPAINTMPRIYSSIYITPVYMNSVH
jgi:hypothetical protein